ncbi:hypothetical protein V6N13_018578 [Hibiscus sabdariffa]
MGGKMFLLTFEDEDLYIMLEDLEWSYLKEIFYKIKVWSETLKSPDRATWIEVRRLPLHVWNGSTLKKIVAIWGNYEAWGENLNRVYDAESTTILITMNHSGRIDETIEVEVGNVIHEACVRELGFKDSTMDPLIQVDQKKTLVHIPLLDTSSESASVQEQVSPSGKEGNDIDEAPLMEQKKWSRRWAWKTGKFPSFQEGNRRVMRG